MEEDGYHHAFLQDLSDKHFKNKFALQDTHDLEIIIQEREHFVYSAIIPSW